MCTCNYVDCKINDTCKCEVHGCGQYDDQEIADMFAQASELEAVERHVAVTQGKIVELEEFRKRRNGKAS